MAVIGKSKRALLAGAVLVVAVILAGRILVLIEKGSDKRRAVPSQPIQLSDVCQLSFCTPENKSFKFGYYNYSPISRDGTKLLAHHVSFEGRLPRASERCEIGYFDLSDASWHALAESAAFNWQQGSMLQWLGPDFNSRVIYNDADETNYVARILTVSTGEKRTVPTAIYAVDPTGSFSITLNFERSYWTRAYAYTTISNAYWNARVPKDDGIFRVDLNSGVRTRIIALEDIVKGCGQEGEGASAHWFEHLMLNPAGTRFAFCHRFGDNETFVTHLYTADTSGAHLWRHPMQAGELLSHMGWRSPKEYVVFSSPKTRAGKAYLAVARNRNVFARMAVGIYRFCVKPFVPTKKAINAIQNSFYALTGDQSGVKEHVATGLLSRDGHPSFTRDGRYMLTDTYADTEGFRHLMVYDCERRRLVPLARFYSQINDYPWRADLHPRFSPDEKKVIIDSSHNGYHQMVVLDLDWAKIGAEK